MRYSKYRTVQKKKKMPAVTVKRPQSVCVDLQGVGIWYYVYKSHSSLPILTRTKTNIQMLN